MIVANLATYPPREGNLENVVKAMHPQVDQLNIVLNEFESVPAFLAPYERVNPIIPPEDTKDVGKFYPDVSKADFVFLIDDDINYPADYVAKTLAAYKDIGTTNQVGGYHCSTYVRPRLRLTPDGLRSFLRFWLKPRRIDMYRRFHHFGHDVETSVYVDQLGTGAVVATGQLMPSYDYMRDSQKFVDVRFAKFCHENGIDRVALPRTPSWLTMEDFDETIAGSFTLTSPPHVAREIRRFAFKSPRVGAPVEPARKGADTHA